MSEKIAVVYWSGTGNTKCMAEEIIKGMQESGADVTIMGPGEYDTNAVVSFDKIAFGCSAMGDEQLEETEFEPFFQEVEGQLSGKKVALFGSYDWNEGQWISDWSYRVSNKGANIFDEGLAVKSTPDEEAKQVCFQWGKNFAAY